MSQVQDARILFVDAGFRSIGQELMQVVSEVELIAFERPYIHTDSYGDKSVQHYGFGYGAIPVPKHNTKIRMLYASGNLRLETGIKVFLDDAKADMSVILGFIFLVDASKMLEENPYDKPRIMDAYQYLKEFADVSQCLFVVLNSDQPNTATIAEIPSALNLEDTARIITCEKQDRENAKKMLLKLIVDRAANDIFVEAIQAL